MSNKGRVVVAMSGGVDSSVAAALLQEQGYECLGVFMRVSAEAIEVTPPVAAGAEDQTRRLRHGCCSATDAADARTVAGKLGIPFYALNFQADFEKIIDYFVDEYARARTPNPCIICNTRLKFGKLLDYADTMDAQFVATGHYARIVEHDGQSCLARSLNAAKDQTYVLHGIRRENLGRCLFPLGEMADKADVRRIASQLGLRVHDKPESQEICFVPDDDYKRLLRQRRPDTQRPGEVRDAAGNVLGRHEGIVNYTVGQRRGLGIAAGAPIYVTKLDAESNVVTVGPREEILSGGLVAGDMNWLTDAPPVGGWQPALVKIRHQHQPTAGRFRVLVGNRVQARFDQPQSAVTPGQAAVLYRADGVVLGGGWIENSTPTTEFGQEKLE